MNLQNLHAPFPPNEIEWRVGSTNQDKTSGLALAYLTARHVMERLDEVCGADNWQDRYEFHGKRTVCYLSIRIGTEWVTKADGAGDSDVEAEKGAISDALKRAAVKWGIGRYLYSLGSTWVQLKKAGNSYKIETHEFPKLERILRDKFGVPPSDMGNVNVTPEEPVPAQPVASDHVLTINAAKTPDEAKEAFGAAWTSTTDPEQRARYKQAYEAKKTDLATPLNFDDLPPATQQAVKVARV